MTSPMQSKQKNQRICRQVGTRPEKKREPTGRAGAIAMLGEEAVARLEAEDD
jgi:hypothetical protein